MPVDAYVVRYRTHDHLEFLSFVLASPDYDVSSLKNICRTHGLNQAGKKTELVDRIVHFASSSDSVFETIAQNIISRAKSWLTFKLGPLPPSIQFLNPIDILKGPGEEDWYGPIKYGNDQDAEWYVRPVFVGHWEILEGFEGVQNTKIRWLFFARITNNVLSYHWRGFSFTDAVENIKRQNSQFPYWEYVPSLINEFEQRIQARPLISVNLHDLILHKIWDKFRYDANLDWRDLKIRAESGGVSLNARTSASVELDVLGIRRLANTIRRSIDYELISHTGSDLPDGNRYDEVILRTIIRELGALSYEFILKNNLGNNLFRGHCYFGQKQDQSSPDTFAHINLHTTSRPELEQLQFLVDFIAAQNANTGAIRQASLLS